MPPGRRHVRHTFTPRKADAIRALLRRLRRADRLERAQITGCLRRVYGFWISDWRERFFLARTKHVRASASNMALTDLEEFREHRWWSLHELQQSTETFVPGRLATLLVPLLRDELPDSPIDTGI